MYRSFSPHDSFFSSLSQVEKRLASEKEAEEAEPSYSSSSPLFLLSNNPEPIHHQATANTGNGSSGPPLDFLSNSPTNTQFQQQQAQDDGDEDHQGVEEDDDDIDQLVSLLGLSLPPNQKYSSCDCSCSQGGGGGFFRNVVGVKGPRCGKEMERLDAWIHTLYSSKTTKTEPARLAHLLLGKAAALASNNDGGGSGGDGFGAVGFPASVHNFLEHDPPPPQEKED